MIGLLSLHVGDLEVAEELAQDVLATLCEHWPTVNDPVAWVNRVAINQANSWWRRRHARRRATARHRAAQVEDRPPDHADAIAVRHAVAALPNRQRTALVHRYYAGLNVAETADAMSCAPGTVRALTHQALTSLRERGGLHADQETIHART